MSTRSRPTTDRRQFPRLSMLHELHGHLVAVNEPFLVADLGLGGFAVESPIPFPAGVIHTFRFTLGSLAVALRAKAVHCLRADDEGEMPSYTSGFEFIVESVASRRAIESLVIYARKWDSTPAALDTPLHQIAV